MRAGKASPMLRSDEVRAAPMRRRNDSGRSGDFRPLKPKPRVGPGRRYEAAAAMEAELTPFDSVAPANCENTHCV